MAVDHIFLDTNALIHASLTGASLHKKALDAIRAYYDSGAALWISRQVLREYMAALTRDPDPSKRVPAASLVGSVRRLEAEFRIAEDGPHVTSRLLQLILQQGAHGKQIHDANIVATMLTHGIDHLLT